MRYLFVFLVSFFCLQVHADRLNFNVEDASTKVLFKKIELVISSFVIEGQTAVGSYNITVANDPVRSDFGYVVFDIDKCVNKLVDQGGVIEGICFSEKDSEMRYSVLCEIKPGEDLTSGVLVLQVKTKSRELSFETLYTYERQSVYENTLVASLSNDNYAF